MKIIDGPIKKQIQEAIKMYDELPDWLKEPEYENNPIVAAAEELGKSLAKIMMSMKYDQFSIQDSIGILNLALPVAVDILLKEEKEQGEGK